MSQPGGPGEPRQKFQRGIKPAEIILGANPAAEHRGIISNGVKEISVNGLKSLISEMLGPDKRKVNRGVIPY